MDTDKIYRLAVQATEAQNALKLLAGDGVYHIIFKGLRSPAEISLDRDDSTDSAFMGGLRVLLADYVRAKEVQIRMETDE